MKHRSRAPHHLGKTARGTWAVFRVEQHPKIGEVRTVLEQFLTFEEARRTFANGGNRNAVR